LGSQCSIADIASNLADPGVGKGKSTSQLFFEALNTYEDAGDGTVLQLVSSKFL